MTAFGRSFLFAVPELTPSTDIKLNKRVSLWRHPRALSLPHRTLPGRTPRQSRQAIIFRLAALFCAKSAYRIEGRAT
jgi:hypothetical protein